MLVIMRVVRSFVLCCELMLCLTLLASTVYAQESPDTYTRSRLGADSRIYNGREYIRNGTPAKGFANFEWDTLHPGSLDYDGIAWSDIPLEYDLAQDQVVIRDYSTSLLISLVPEKIRTFSIGPCRFRYMAPGAAQLPEPGFYQELFASGNLSLLARRHKTLVPPTSADETARYVQVNTYYILLDGIATGFGSSKELLQILKDKRDDLKRFIRKNHLSFHRDFEGSLVQTVTYYRQIKF
jgi:hypothetical protein